MVQLDLYMTRSDTFITCGKGESYVEAAADLKRRTQKARPSILLLDFDAVVKALQNEHMCHCVTTGSKFDEFTVQRRNLYRQKLPMLDRIRIRVVRLLAAIKSGSNN